MTASDLEELRCDAPAALRGNRIARRWREGTDLSDATEEVARHIGSSADPWPSAIGIDTSGGSGAAREAAQEAIEAPHPARRVTGPERES